LWHILLSTGIFSQYYQQKRELIPSVWMLYAIVGKQSGCKTTLNSYLYVADHWFAVPDYSEKTQRR